MPSPGGEIRAKQIKPVLFRLKPSPRYKEVGVFAVRDIRKGAIIAAASEMREDYFLPWEEFDKLDPATRETVLDFCPQDEDGLYGPDNLNYLPTTAYMNHSCDGNVGCDKHSNFVAIRNIKKGEELCFDYALVISNPDYGLECRCGAKKCRHIISGHDWRDPAFQKKNYQHMSPQVKELVDRDRLNKKR